MDTDSFEEQLREGEERLARGQAAEAVSCLQRCVELRPDDARARLSLGQALSEIGRDAEALGQLEQAIALDASQVREALTVLGDAFATVEDATRAMARVGIAPDGKMEFPEFLAIVTGPEPATPRLAAGARQ